MPELSKRVIETEYKGVQRSAEEKSVPMTPDNGIEEELCDCGVLRWLLQSIGPSVRYSGFIKHPKLRLYLFFSLFVPRASIL